MDIKEKIEKLEIQLNTYKDGFCLHEEVSFNGYSIYYGGDIYICDRCGRVFVSKKYKEWSSS